MMSPGIRLSGKGRGMLSSVNSDGLFKQLLKFDAGQLFHYEVRADQ